MTDERSVMEEPTTVRRDRIVLAAIALGFFLFYMVLTSRHFIGNEHRSLAAIRDGRSLVMEPSCSPLYLAMGWFSSKVAAAAGSHDTIAVLHRLNALLAALGLWFFSLLVLRLTGRLGAAVGACLFLGSTYAYSLHATHMTDGVASFPFLVVGVTLAVRAHLERQVMLASLSGLFMGIALCGSQAALMVLPATVVTLVWTSPDGKYNRWLFLGTHLVTLIAAFLLVMLAVAALQNPPVFAGKAVSSWMSAWDVNERDLGRKFFRSVAGFVNGWFHFLGRANPGDMIKEGVTLRTLYRFHVLAGCAVLLFVGLRFYRSVKSRLDPEHRRWLLLFALWAVPPAVMNLAHRDPWSESLWIMAVSGIIGAAAVLYPVVFRELSESSRAKAWLFRAAMIAIITACFGVNVGTGLVPKWVRPNPYRDAASDLAAKTRPADLIIGSTHDSQDHLPVFLKYGHRVRFFDLNLQARSAGTADPASRLRKDIEETLKGGGEVYFIGVLERPRRELAFAPSVEQNRALFEAIQRYKNQSRVVTSFPESISSRSGSGLWKYTPTIPPPE